MVKITCPVCGGSGKIPPKYPGTTAIDDMCLGCNGTGIQEVSDESYMKGRCIL